MLKARIRNDLGFTLIELSIVLVVIGLLVGGVLIGRDLIIASEVRATVSQVDKYRSAVNTFRLKYGDLPGDIGNTYPNPYGLYIWSGSITKNDGLIGGYPNYSLSPYSETLGFWRNLSDANLVDGQFGSIGCSRDSTFGAILGPGGTSCSVDLSFPVSKGFNQHFIVFNDGMYNYYGIYPIAYIGGTGNWRYIFGNSGIPPIQAYNMDTKMDDGMPISGVMQAQGITAVNTAPTAAATPTAATCVVGDTAGTATGDAYNVVSSSGGNDPSCGLRVRF